MTNKKLEDLIRSLRELMTDLKGETGAWARGYRAGLQDALAALKRNSEKKPSFSSLLSQREEKEGK